MAVAANLCDPSAGLQCVRNNPPPETNYMFIAITFIFLVFTYWKAIYQLYTADTDVLLKYGLRNSRQAIALDRRMISIYTRREVKLFLNAIFFFSVALSISAE